MRRVLLLIIVVSAIASTTSFLLVKNRIYKEEKYNIETEVTGTTNEISGDDKLVDEELIYNKSYNFNYEFSGNSKNNSVINDTTWKINYECVADKDYDDFHRNMIRFEFKDNVCTFYGYGSFRFSGRFYIKDSKIYVHFTKYEALISPVQEINEYAILKLNNELNLSIIQFPESIYVQMDDNSGDMKWDFRSNDIEKGYIFTNVDELEKRIVISNTDNQKIEEDSNCIDLRKFSGIPETEWKPEQKYANFSENKNTIEFEWNTLVHAVTCKIENKGWEEEPRFIKYSVTLWAGSMPIISDYSVIKLADNDIYESISLKIIKFDKDYLLVKISDDYETSTNYFIFDDVNFNLVLNFEESDYFTSFTPIKHDDTNSKVRYMDSFAFTNDGILIYDLYCGVKYPEISIKNGYNEDNFINLVNIFKITIKDGKCTEELINSYSTEEYELCVGMI